MGRMINFIYAFSLVLVLYHFGNTKKIDLTFLIDTTPEITEKQFCQVIDFVYNIINTLTIGEKDTMVAIVTFNSVPTTQFYLNNYTEKAGILNATNDLKHIDLRGIRATHEVLNHFSSDIYEPGRGARYKASAVVIFITYGESASTVQTMFAADSIPGSFTVFAIGIGAFILDSKPNSELSYIASDPAADHIYYLTDTADLCYSVSDLVKKLDNNSETSENECPTTVSTSTIIRSISFVESTTYPSAAKTFITETSTTNTLTETSVITTIKDDTTVVTSITDFDSAETSSEPTLTGESTTSNVTMISHSPEISSISSSDSSAVIVAIIIMVLCVILIIIIYLFGVLYLPKYRKKKQMKRLINVLVSNYPDIENGLGPSRPKYTEVKYSYKNGHTPKFHTFLKLSKMTNGVRIVSR